MFRQAIVGDYGSIPLIFTVGIFQRTREVGQNAVASRVEDPPHGAIAR
jgi:hypothetical protein